MGWSQPGGGCGDVHRMTVLSGALERHQLAPAQWVRRSGGECECGIVAPMPPPRPNPTPAHPSAHPPSFDDPEDIVPIDVVAIARVVERRRSAARRAIDRDGPMDGGGGGDGRGRFRDPALSTNNTNGGGGSTRG
jgi:hypothetical protein